MKKTFGPIKKLSTVEKAALEKRLTAWLAEAWEGGLLQLPYISRDEAWHILWSHHIDLCGYMRDGKDSRTYPDVLVVQAIGVLLREYRDDRR